MPTTKQRGFTILELIVIIIGVAAIITVFLVQKRDLETAHRDSQRKTAINTIYYNLENAFYITNGAYPQTLNAEILRGLNPDSLKDPEGVAIGQQNSDYSYEPKDCTNNVCKSYILRANLENEADFVKNSRSQ